MNPLLDYYLKEMHNGIASTNVKSSMIRTILICTLDGRKSSYISVDCLPVPPDRYCFPKNLTAIFSNQGTDTRFLKGLAQLKD